MPAQFDPYYRWLGIPAHEQPANHYRLLGINPFESDPDVIEAAADRQMGHLRSYQAGKNAALSQKLLNEVAAARVCLLEPTRKAAYDQNLREELRPESAADPSTTTVRISASPRTPSRKKAAWRIPVGLGAAAVAVLLALFLWPLQETSPPDAVLGNQDVPAQVAAAPGDEPHDTTPQKHDAELGGTEAHKPASKKEHAQLHPTGGAEPETQDPGPVAESTMADSGVDTTTPAVVPPNDLSDDAGADENPEPTVQLPIPSQAKQEEIAQTLEETYGFSIAKSPGDRLQLATELLGANSDDADTRFTLLRKAMELASAGGDAALMLRAAHAIAADFDVDALSVKAKILNAFGQGTRTESRVKSFVGSVEPVIDEALQADRCDVALELVSTAYRMCLGSAGSKYRKAMYDRRKEVQKLHQQWQVCQEALTQLEADPNNANAHSLVGEYWCFTKGDWQQGLPHLAQGTDESLKALAGRDLLAPEAPDEQLALADAWWGLAAARDDTASTACASRAARWYREALPELSGVSKLKVERRLEQFVESGQQEGSPPEKTEERSLSTEEQLRHFTEALRNAKPVNLGPRINSKAYDSSPALSADGCTLVFRSERPGGAGKSDLWMSVRESRSDRFGPPVNMGRGINTGEYESSPVLSADGRLLLFATTRPGCVGHADLWMCSREESRDPFGTPACLGEAINSGQRDSGPFLATDGLNLLFYSDRPGGLGGTDLWESTRASLPKPFASPINMGSTVNTASTEGSPTLSSDGLWLLFDSDRPGGSGNTDLWMSTRTSRKEPYGPPVNLGAAINCGSSDGEPTLSSDNRLLVFNSDRPGGQGSQDLWMLELGLPGAGE